MANLSSSVLSFTLSPQNLMYDSDKYHWISTKCSLSISIRDQTVFLQPEPYICVQQSNFQSLIAGVRKFVEQLRQGGSNINERRSIAEFMFVPLELDFEFACLNGSTFESDDGEVTLRVMLNLGNIDNKLSSEYVGGVLNVPISQLLAFVDTLEDEVAVAIGKASSI